VYFLGEKGISKDPKANSQSTFQITEGISFFSIFTSVNLMHNAQVCYFNNVWLMFLVF
jgi:hypothetical protein